MLAIHDARAKGTPESPPLPPFAVLREDRLQTARKSNFASGRTSPAGGITLDSSSRGVKNRAQTPAQSKVFCAKVKKVVKRAESPLLLPFATFGRFSPFCQLTRRYLGTFSQNYTFIPGILSPLPLV